MQRRRTSQPGHTTRAKPLWWVQWLCVLLPLTSNTCRWSYSQEAPEPKVLPGTLPSGLLDGAGNPQAYSVGSPKALGVGKSAFPRHRLQAAALDPDALRRQLALWEAELPLLTLADATTAESRGVLQTQCGLARLQLGEFAAGEALLLQAEQTFRDVVALSTGSARFARSRQLVLALGNLGLHFQELGDYPAAQARIQSALDLLANAEAADPLRAAVLNDLANLHYDMGDVVEATRLYAELIAALRLYPEDAPSLADALHNLALVHWKTGDFDAARKVMDESLAITQRLPGENGLAHSRESFALICSAHGDDAEADAAYAEALADYEGRVFPPRDAIARVCNNWGLHCARVGRLDQADELLDRGLQLRRAVYGERHLDVADSLQDTGRLRDAQGRSAEGAALLAQALDIVGERLAIVARGQSERQQLAMAAAFREMLDLYLSISLRAGIPAVEVYARVLPVKGAVFERQRELRLARRWPELAPQFTELDLVSGQLARLTFASAGPREIDRWNEQWRSLTQRREILEQSLAAAVGSRTGGSGSSPTDVAALRQSLPADAVLVDYLEYVHHAPVPQRRPPERRLLAFLVTAQGELQRLELGTVAELQPLIDRWRRDLQIGGDGGDAGHSLRTRLWTPLSEAVASAATVLVSPDGLVNRLPLAALPGRLPGTFLLEDQALAIVPTPQYLPALLAVAGGGSATSEDATSLLAVGNIDFSVAAARQAPPADAAAPHRRRRAGELLHWDELPATRGELLAIIDSFRTANPGARTQVLDRAAATEAEVRRAVQQAAYVHFATHGFFASAEFRSALASARGAAGLIGATGVDAAAGLHPGLLSGLVLSGANSPPAEGDDGVLTALEAAELDLSRVELAVLSACETGLGETAGGEGVLGLQRAFQVAGARTVVASLWKVDDEQTRQLMERFYDNYWRRELGMLESLREAQLWMLKEVSARDLRLGPKTAAAGQVIRTPPYYWAPFVLSGDWR